MPARIAIVDYGMGNILSVKNALSRCGASAELTSDPTVLRDADGLILPGVGAFGEAMSKLNASGLVQPLLDMVRDGKPLLGICLGMQLLARDSDERGSFRGLGLINGVVRKIPVGADLRLPHIGWNTVEISQQQPLFAGLENDDTFYFVHSYWLQCDAASVSAVTDYGGRVTAAVQTGNVFGVQFHPERSQSNGMRLLANFVDYVRQSRTGVQEC